MPKKTYITTPIYYVNSEPHAGHALTMLVCEATKLHRQMLGEEVVFLTGTDENGLKILDAAAKAGEDTQAFVDRISQTFVNAWDELKFTPDIFFRTTCQQHKRAVQHFFKLVQENGYLYTDNYEGWYDVSSETFIRESELVDGKSPDGNPVTWVSEQNYFFKLSAFGDRLLEHIEQNPEFLQPEGRKNEVVSFIKGGLRDMCITRANPGWGIPFPGDESKVVYVWFDALINYLAATGWPDTGWEEMWPADIHWMAKEIFTRFHATLWPAMLMAAGLPLPKTVIAHGWFVFGDAKMSKSLGNVMKPADMIRNFEEVGCSRELAIDAVKWCLGKSTPYESDTNFTGLEVARTYNSDLANDIGNALNRSLNMAHKFVDGVVPQADVDPEANNAIQTAVQLVCEAFRRNRIDEACEGAISLVRFVNKYVDTQAPWALAKKGDPKLAQVLYSILLCLRATEGLIKPFMPVASATIAQQLNVPPIKLIAEIGTVASLPPGTKLNPPVPMFPRMDLSKLMEPEVKTPEAPAPVAKPEKPLKGLPEPAAEVSIDEFFKLDLRVARIIEAAPVEGSNKLMKLQVQVGDVSRQILAGIQQQYSAEDLIGRQVVVVFNLKPAKLMGHESNGMVMAADGPDGGAILLMPDSEAPEGSRVH